MGLYGDKKDYQEMVTENIAIAKLIYTLNETDKAKVLELINKKNQIIEENKIFANIKLANIDKKIKKIKENSLKPNYNNTQNNSIDISN